MNQNPTLEQALQSAMDQLRSSVKELTFQKKGYPFTAIRSRSAREFFGEGWQEQVRKYFSAEALFTHGEKNGLALYDVQLSEIISDQKQLVIRDVQRWAKYSEQEKNNFRITLNVTAGDPAYNGTHLILSAENNKILIPVIRSGDAVGTYSDTRKVETLQEKINNLEGRIADIRHQVAANEPVTEPVNEPVLRYIDLHHEKVQKKKFPVVEVLVGVSVVAGIIYFMIPDNELKMAA